MRSRVSYGFGRIYYFNNKSIINIKLVILDVLHGDEKERI